MMGEISLQTVAKLVSLAAASSPREVSLALRKHLARRNQSRALSRFQSALRRYHQNRLILFETARIVSAAERRQITTQLAQRWPQVAIEFRVSPKLLGGFRILVGSELYDYSLAQNLKALQTQLTEVSHD